MIQIIRSHAQLIDYMRSLMKTATLFNSGLVETLQDLRTPLILIKGFSLVDCSISNNTAFGLSPLEGELMRHNGPARIEKTGPFDYLLSALEVHGNDFKLLYQVPVQTKGNWEATHECIKAEVVPTDVNNRATELRVRPYPVLTLDDVRKSIWVPYEHVVLN